MRDPRTQLRRRNAAIVSAAWKDEHLIDLHNKRVHYSILLADIKVVILFLRALSPDNFTQICEITYRFILFLRTAILFT